MNRTGFIFRRILDLALVVMFGLSIALAAADFVLPKLGHQLILIDGGSMAPTIGNGSSVIVASAPETLHVGDIVTIRVPSSGTLFTHRIVEVTSQAGEPALRTKGDANDAPDAALSPASWVVGRVEVSIPGFGLLAGAIQTGAGRAALISLLVLILALRALDDPEERRTALVLSDRSQPRAGG